MADESNAGEDRSAQTGSAVTRPTAVATGTRTVSTERAPAAARVSRQTECACAAGTSETKGLAALIPRR